jgi:hypothetical protein
MCRTVPEKKNGKLYVALAALWRVLHIVRRLDVRADVGHGEALVFFTGAGRTFPKILFTLVKSKFLPAI